MLQYTMFSSLIPKKSSDNIEVNKIDFHWRIIRIFDSHFINYRCQGEYFDVIVVPKGGYFYRNNFF